MWAMAENVIVDGNSVLCAPGGAKGRVVALDKTTGKTLWANTEIDQRPAYCSPIIFARGGVRQYVTIMASQVVSVDVRSGKLLWTHSHRTAGNQNVTMPIHADGKVYVSSGHGTGGRLLQIAPDSRSVKQLWVDTDQDNCHGGIILRKGHVFGHGCRLYGKGFVCVDLATGKTVWTHKPLGKVSLTWAEDRFYCISDRAKVSLVKADASGCSVVSQFDLPRGKNLTLSHPVVCGKRLYIRHWNDLYAFDVSAETKKE
jgi:outer membrane protein assembly factor BamB